MSQPSTAHAPLTIAAREETRLGERIQSSASHAEWGNTCSLRWKAYKHDRPSKQHKRKNNSLYVDKKSKQVYQWYKYANKLHFNIHTIHTRHIYVETLKTRGIVTDAHTNQGERCGSSCQRERERKRERETDRKRKERKRDRQREREENHSFSVSGGWTWKPL